MRETAALLGLRPVAKLIINTVVANVWLAPGASDLHMLEDADGIPDVRHLDP